MLDWIRGLFESGPTYNWIVELDGDGFVTNARLEPSFESDEFDKLLVIEFEEAVREGNEVAHINVGRDGTIFNRFELYSGDSAYKAGVKPSEEVWELATIGMDDMVISSQQLSFKYVPLEEADENWD
jgi:hypothetical protein